MKEFFADLLKPAKTTAAVLHRLTNIAVIAGLVCILFLMCFATVPLWVAANYVPKFQVLFLTGTACFALLAVGLVGAKALIKRNLY